jgi:hypothetical protein
MYLQVPTPTVQHESVDDVIAIEPFSHLCIGGDETEEVPSDGDIDEDDEIHLEDDQDDDEELSD